MRAGIRGEAGSVTAEFAMILPAAALVLVLGLGVGQLGAVQTRLTDAAADAARMLGRGDPPGAASARVAAVHPGATSTVSRGDGLVCVTTSASVSPGSLGSLFTFEGHGCALDDQTPP